jgi:hypothetical protein
MSGKVRIDAMAVLVDIENGLNHVHLMEKYSLSPKGLRSLLLKLKHILANFPRSNNKIDAYLGLVLNSTNEFVGMSEEPDENKLAALCDHSNFKADFSEILEDLLCGMNSEELMRKHEFTKMQLRNIFEELANAGELQKKDGHYVIPEWQPPQLDFVWARPLNDNQTQRRYLIAATAVRLASDPDIKGELLEVAGDRILIKGISSPVNRVCTLVMQSENFLSGKPLVFDARCDWTRLGFRNEKPTAEFTITNMAECVQEEFYEFLSSLTLTMHPMGEPENMLGSRM